MDDSVTIHFIEDFRALEAAGTVAGIWSQASGVRDDDAAAFVSGTFPKHVRWPGFRLYVASIDGHPVGFVYGYHSQPGQWWYDEVAPALTAADREEWLNGACELAEIAVLPRFQNRGIGSRLIEAFLGTSDKPVLLAVEATEPRIRHLYAAHGFQDLLTDFHYSGWPDDHIVIMGRSVKEETAS